MATIERRRILQAVGVAGLSGSMVGLATGSSGDSTPYCPDCPEGTELLAKYEWDENRNGFIIDDASACDAVDFTEVTTDAEGEPVGVKWESDLFYTGLSVKQGVDACDSFTREETNLDNNEKDGAYLGEVTKDDLVDCTAISYIAFCAGVCVQADFVFGDPIQNPGVDDSGFYSKRKLIHIWGNGLTQRVNSTKVPHQESRDGCTATVTDASVDFSTDTLSVSFTVDEESCDLSLVSYVAPCPIGFTKSTADRQHVLDTVSKDGVTGSGTWTVDLPTPSDLGALCQDTDSVG